FCMRAADTAVVVIDAVDGVKVQTEQAWEFATEYGMPCIIFVNKLDKERAILANVLEDANRSLESPKPIPLQIPIGQEAGFKGIVDLMRNKAYTYEDGKASEIDIPADLVDEVASERETLIENIAEADD